MMVERFAEMCRGREMKVNVGKSKVMILNGEGGLECEVHIDGILLEHVSEFKYSGVFSTHQIQMEQNAVERWQAGGDP